MASVNKTKEQIISEMDQLQADAVEREYTGETLRESEERYRTIVEDMPLLICCFLPDGEITYVNDAYCRYFKKTAKELVGHVFLLLIPEQDREVVMANISSLTVESPMQSHEHRVIASDDEVRWQHWTNRAMFDTHGKVIAYQSIGKDITERKQTEEALQKSEEKYRTLVGNIPGVSYRCRCDEHWTMEFISDEIENLSGYPVTDFLQNAVRSYGSIINPEDRKISGLITLKNIAREEPFTIEYRIATADGSIRWVYEKGQGIFDEQGKVRYLDGVIVDITERKQAEKELENIFNLSPDMICVCTPEGKLLKVNPSCQRILGYTQEEIIKIGWAKLVHPDDVESTNKEVEKQLKDCPIAYFVNRYKHKDGSYRILEWQASPSANGIVYATARDITERKQVEEALRQKDFIINSASSVIATANMDGNMTYVNPAFLATWGFGSPDEVIGRPFPEFWMVDDIMDEIMAALTDKERKWNGEIKAKKKDGTVFDMQVSASTILDGNGGPIGLMSTSVDITNRKQAEEKQKIASERLRLSIENMLEGYALHEAIFDQTGRMVDFKYLEFNPVAQKIVNITREKIIGKTALQLFPCIVERGLMDKYADVMATGKSVYIEDFYYEGDALDKAFDISCFRLDEKHFVCIFRDITEQKQAEEKITQAKECFDRLTDNANEVIFRVNAKDNIGSVIYVNSAAERIFGYSREEWLNNKSLGFEIIHPDYRDRQKQIHEVIVAKKETMKDVVLVWIAKDGRKVIMEYTIIPVVGKDGEILYFESIGRDITERKQAEVEREELLKSVSAKNAELQSIVYVASHDLKSPLVNIEGFGGELSKSCDKLQTLLLNTEPDADEKTKIQNLLKEDIPESLKFITAGTKKIQMLLDGLLQVSRVGTAMINIQPIDMNKVLNDICDAMEFQFSDTNTDVVIDDLPSCLGDIVLTNQVFSNLIDNAIKYIEPNRPGKIHLSGWTDGSMTTYCVEDNGMGLAQDHIEKIFEIFYRLDPDDSAGGEGLGLSIVMRILDRLNGHIRVESQLGKGSKFFVSLPIVKS